MNYVIVGNSAAGIGGIEGIRMIDKKSNITVISDEKYHTYSRPLISYYLANKVSLDDMKYRKDDFYKENNVQTFFGEKVVSVNKDDKVVELISGKQIDFDKLLLATGANPFIPPITGSDKEGIETFINLDDAKDIGQKIENEEIKEVVILGAGLIGLKAAEALLKLGIKVKVVELADRILSAILDKKSAQIVQSYLEDKGISFILEDTIKEFLGDSKVEGAILESGTELECGLAVIAVGVRANTDIVEGTDIKLNRGIIVDNNLESNIEGIYAAGDVSEGYDLVQDKSSVIPIWPNAYHQGLVAGQNMAGVEKSYQQGFARNSIGFFNLDMITAGVIEAQDDDCEVLTTTFLEDTSYRKIILKNNRIIGFILLNQIDRAGILTGLIKEQKDVSKFKDELLKPDFGYLSFDKDERESLIKGD